MPGKPVHSRLHIRSRWLNLRKGGNQYGENKGDCRCQPKGRRRQKHQRVLHRRRAGAGWEQGLASGC